MGVRCILGVGIQMFDNGVSLKYSVEVDLVNYVVKVHCWACW
jgi:hypothetical protein